MINSLIHTNLLWDLALLFGALAGFYFLFIFFIKRKLVKGEKSNLLTKDELAPVISNFLFHSTEDPVDEQKDYIELKIKIRNNLKRKRFRKTVNEVLLDLSKDVSGTVQERLFRLYRQLDLHLDAIDKLKSWNWTTIAQGLLELSEMKVHDSYQLVASFLNDKRPLVRKQAEIAVTRMHVDGLDLILDTTKYRISQWQQLKLIEALNKLNDYSAPPFKNWLLSDNTDVVLFSLRLIKYFNQNDAEPAILELVKHKNESVRLGALDCILEFDFIDGITVAKAIFSKDSVTVKLKVLDLMAKLGSQEDIPFLKHIWKTEKESSVRNKIAATLNIIEPNSILPSKDIMNVEPQIFEETSFEEKEEPSIAISSVTVSTSENEDEPLNKEEDNLPIEQTPIKEEEIECIELETEIELVTPGVVFPVIDHADTTESDFTVERNEDDIDHEAILSEEEKHVAHKKEEDEAIDTAIIEPAFELLELDGIEKIAFNEEIGLIEFPIEEDATPSLDKQQFLELYQSIGQEEKEEMLQSLKEYGDEQDYDKLEVIIETEDNSEIRFRAFNILSDIKKAEELAQEEAQEQPIIITEDLDEIQEVENYGEDESIFCSLFNHAADLDSKRILLDEMAKVGDSKELPFLHKLLQEEEVKLTSKINKTIEKIHNRITDKGKIPSSPDKKLVATKHTEGYEAKIPLQMISLLEEMGVDCTDESEEETFHFEFTDLIQSLENPKNK